MSETVIKVENLSKQYRLGTIGTGTLRSDFQRFWANLLGKEDPTLKIGQENTLQNKEPRAKNQNDYVWALRDINFEVKQGEVLGIIGKNGAGKSTLLKILSQVTTPSTGNVKVKGRIASLLEVGTGFHPDLTGRENIFLNGAILGMTKAEIRSKFDEIVDFAGIAKYIDTPVKRYSSGMYVRLAFAVAAHLEPEILIVDEVLAVGDTEFQKKALGKMQQISQGQGRTVLFVSHNMTSMLNLCNSGILMESGIIADIGKIEYAVEKYLTRTNNEYNRFDIKKAIDDGDHKVTITNFYIYPEIPKSGDNIEFYFELFNHGEDIEIDVAVSLRDKNESKIIQFFSQHMSQKLNARKGSNKISIIAEKLPVAQGIYPVNLWIGNGNHTFHWLRDSFILKIEAGRIHGENYAKFMGYPIILNSKWEIFSKEEK